MNQDNMLLRYRQTHGEDTERTRQSQGRPTPDRVSSQYPSQNRDVRASREYEESGDRSVNQGGRQSNMRRGAVEDQVQQDPRESHLPRDQKDDTSSSRGSRGQQGRGAENPPDRSPSRGGRSSHASNEEMRREIVNKRDYWRTICSIALAIAVLLLVLWLLLKGFSMLAVLSKYTDPCRME